MVNSWKKTCGIASDLFQKWPINFLILLIPVQRLTFLVVVVKYKLMLNCRTSLNQKGLKRQQSTALNWFQPDHDCSTCIDETQSVRKLPLPHYHAKISTQTVDPHLARHNVCKKDYTCSSYFWKFPPLSQIDDVLTCNPLKFSRRPPPGRRDG